METTKSKRAPKVFISYTHEADFHTAWVTVLARDLRSNGVDAILDIWECKFGADLPYFMEKGIRDADRVLLVCTPTYKGKSGDRLGGAGYEGMVVTAALASGILSEKFVCILRLGNENNALPDFARGRLYIDFRDDADYKKRLEQLVRDVLQTPKEPKPPIGQNPFETETAPINFSSAGNTEVSETDKPPVGPNPFDPDPHENQLPPKRRLMPETKIAISHQFDISGHHGQITVGMYEDGNPCEIRINMEKDGSTIGGLLGSLALSASLALQYGVPLEVLVRHFAYQRFDPAGPTKNPDIRHATSIVDYVFRWLGCQFIKGYKEAISPQSKEEK